MRNGCILKQYCLLGIALMTRFVSAGGERDTPGFEFGRHASRPNPKRKLQEVDVIYRELFDAEMFSMSMAMSLPLDKRDYTPSPTARPTTSFPTTTPVSFSSPTSEGSFNQVVVNSTRPGCDEGIQTLKSFALEVETAVGKDSFSDSLGKALKSALAAEYLFCDTPGRRERRLQDLGILLGDIVVVDEGNSCEVQSELADQCQMARVDVLMSGAETGISVADLFAASVQSIIENDQAFDDELMLEGIVDVRLVEETQDATPKAALGTSDTSSSGSPATAAVVSFAAVGAVVLAALAFRRSHKKDEYIDVDGKEGSVINGDEESNADTLPATIAGSNALEI